MTTGEGTYFAEPPHIRGSANQITIGKYCSIAASVIFDSGFNHNSNLVSTYPFRLLNPEVESNIVVKGDINIGSDVWIGEQAVIMSGVTIGHGAVIGMRAIVSKDVGPYEVIVGAPQKVLRKRFTESQIEALLEISWWNWNQEKIIDNAHLLNGNIEDFINKHL